MQGFFYFILLRIGLKYEIKNTFSHKDNSGLISILFIDFNYSANTIASEKRITNGAIENRLLSFHKIE